MDNGRAPGRGAGRWPLRAGVSALALSFVFQPSLAQRLDPKSGPESLTIDATVDGRKKRMGISLDANYRWLYNDDQKACDSGDKAEMEGCYLQGLDREHYEDTYGIFAGVDDPTEVRLQYAAIGKYNTKPNYGTRLFLTDMESDEGNGYYNFKLVGSEISFTLDLSNVPAGMNAAVYLISMDPMGNQGATYPDGQTNEAGWKRGVGYCDAQCPKDLFFTQDVGYHEQGRVMSCCPEMDLFEGNRFAAAMTAHPCSTVSRTTCDTNTSECTNPCDTDGADVNLFRRWGPHKSLFQLLDLQKPVTIRTRFIDEGGIMTKIEQVYEQEENGKMVQKFNMTIDDQPIAEQKKLFDEPNVFADVGGVAKMGDAMDRGMVLSLAIWADPDSNMNWLDSCMQNISKFDCSLHPTFDSTDVFWEAWREQPGAWRGPVDVYPHLNTSFESQTITLSYPYVPMWMKTQTPFQCAKTVGSFDCSAVKYGFSVKDIQIRSLHPSSFPWFWMVAVAVALLVGGGAIYMMTRGADGHKGLLSGSDSEGYSSSSSA